MERSSPLLVVAIGGNAIQDPAGEDSVESDFRRTSATARVLVELVAGGAWRLVVTHGNGPQVGNHLLRSELGVLHGDLPELPLEVCVADTQGGMGYVIQQCLGNALHDKGLPGVAATVITQVVVDPGDPAFATPSKPVGEMIPPARADEWRARGYTLDEDPRGRGFRRVVASPEPQEIVEGGAIAALLDAGAVVIAAGGGGIPVVHSDNGLAGVPAVVDKDLAASLLAADLGAAGLLVLTDVEQVMLGFDTPGARPIDEMSVAEARAHMQRGEFPAGSMGPKVEAACRFAEATGTSATIAAVDRAVDALAGNAGTRIVSG